MNKPFNRSFWIAAVAVTVCVAVGAPCVMAVDAPFLVEAQRKETVTTTWDSLMGTLINAGRFVKAGDARLTVQNAFLANGTEEVAAGTLALGDGAGDLPSALRDGAGLAFWVDANRNVATDESGTVTNWYDVREYEGGSAYPRAHQYGSELAPTLVTGGDDVAGLKLVDFGFFSSGKWLQWQDASGNQYRIGNIRAVFLAVSCTNGTGFLLGDTEGNPGGHYCFHVGNSGADGLATTWWQPGGDTGDDSRVKFGRTFVNGVLTDGRTRPVSHFAEVMSVQTVWDAWASNFCNDRNLTEGNAWGVTPSRLGGGRIGEALIYTTDLTEGQRKQVEAYLMKKWLRKSLGTVRVNPGATLAATATNTLDLAGVTGAGTLELTGAGRATLPDVSNIALPTIRLAAGASAAGTLCSRPGQPVMLEGGAAFETANGVCTRTTQADATMATKTGGGVLTVPTIPAEVTRVSVAEGTLRISPPLPGKPGTLAGALENGGFESHDPSRLPDGNGLIYMYTPGDPTPVTDNGWTYSFVQGSSGNCGLARTASAFCPRQPSDGDWVMFLCNDCSVSQSFTVSTKGRYEVSFKTAAAGAPNWPWHVYQVLVDEATVIGSIRTSEGALQSVTCRTPSLEAGTHTLRFLGIKEPDQNRVSIVDNVEIRPCIEADEVEVPNGGFEVPTLLTMSSSGERPYAYFQSQPAGAGWTFSGTYTGTTEGYGTFWHWGMDEGGHAAILNNYNGGSMSVPIIFPTGGVYRITLRAGRRTARHQVFYNTWEGGGSVYDNTFSISLGGVEAARVNPTTGYFAEYTFTLPPVTDDALTQTLTLQTVSGSYFATAVIDDVRIFKMPPLKNPGFEDVSEAGIAWTLDNGGGVVTGITTPGNYYWNGEIPEGARCLVMANDGSARQNVTFETSGTYEVSFLASQSYRTAPGHQFAVTFGGMQVGSVQTMDTTFRRYAFRLPHVVAGQSYALVLQGLTPPGTWYASLIDSVILRKIVPEPTALDGKLLEKTKFALASGATLELDYPGVIELGEFSYGGIPRTGTLNAATTPYIRGSGSFLVKPKGAVLLLR